MVLRVLTILCEAIFVMGRLGPRRGGGEVMGQTASLLAKAAHHVATIAPWERKAVHDHFPKNR